MLHSVQEDRIGDAEREATLAKLQQHFAAGRLELSELEERSQRVARARFSHELRAQLAGLPSRALPVEEESLVEVEVVVKDPEPVAEKSTAWWRRPKEIWVTAALVLAVIIFLFGVWKGLWWSWLAFIVIPGVASLFLIGDQKETTS